MHCSQWAWPVPTGPIPSQMQFEARTVILQSLKICKIFWIIHGIAGLASDSCRVTGGQPLQWSVPTPPAEPCYVGASRARLDSALTPLLSLGCPGGAKGKEPACQCWKRKRRGFDPWVGKIPWRRAQQPTPVFLPGESHGQRSLKGYSLQGRRESYTTEAT